MRYSSAGAEPEPEPEPEPVGEPLRPPPRPAGAQPAQFVSANAGGCAGGGATASTCAMVAIIDLCHGVGGRAGFWGRVVTQVELKRRHWSSCLELKGRLGHHDEA